MPKPLTWCQTHGMTYPHNVTARMPDGRKLADAERELACRPIPAPAKILEA